MVSAPPAECDPAAFRPVKRQRVNEVPGMRLDSRCVNFEVRNFDFVFPNGHHVDQVNIQPKFNWLCALGNLESSMCKKAGRTRPQALIIQGKKLLKFRSFEHS